MGNAMQVFQNEEFGKLRMLYIDDEPWFVGKDVAGALGYGQGKSLNNAVLRHVDDEDKGVTETVTPGGTQKIVIINESGLYSLILSSKLESAKRFKRWITSEVLPAIRKHGAYMTDALLAQAAKNADVIAQVTQALYLERCNNQHLTNQLALTEAKLENMLPKAQYYDAFVDPADNTGIRETARLLKVRQSMFTSYLLRKGYVYLDAKGELRPHALACRNGILTVREYLANNGHMGTQTMVTPKGKALFTAQKEEIVGLSR